MYTKGDFCEYLNRFRVDKGCENTHTSIVKPSGAFYIPGEDHDEFMRRYEEARVAGEELYVTEKHRDISPFLIDLDFRFSKMSDLTRRYTKEHVLNLLCTYARLIFEYVDTPTADMYVMEKPAPVYDKEYMKDGLHILVPNIVTKPSVQFIIRKRVLQEIPGLLHGLDLKNSWEDIVDEAVISRNNWQMYGSKKPNGQAYKTTMLVRFHSDGTFEELPFTEDGMVAMFSIRNKYERTPVKIEKEAEIKEFESTMNVKRAVDTRFLKSNTKKNTCDNLEYVERLVHILSPARAERYDDWIRTGWCLRNIDHRLLPVWIEFSKKSAKFVDGECEKMWNYMRDDGLGIGTLVMWAKQDNPEEFRKIQETDLDSLIVISKNQTHHDIAKVVHFIFRYDYVCVSIRQNAWYEFKNHRWVECDSGHTLRAKISDDIARTYLKAAGKYNMLAAAAEEQEQREKYAETAKKFNEISLKLRQTSFKDNIIKECRELFYLSKFEEKLDSRPHLIGFENGVYDLELGEFREGRPEDFISFTTGINYIPYDADHMCQQELMDCLSKILMKPDIRKYVLLLLASCLNGDIREEKFHIWTGVGANGKSKIIELFEACFGDYCCKFPITLLTQKRAASNAATSELARAKGKRFAVLQEPGDDEKLNVGLMKELSGGDKIQARALFKEPIEFKPQFKMILVCNHLPHVSADDDGTWRRLRVVEYTSKFTMNPDPNKPHEFLMDTELSKKFEDWKEHFMALLIEYYKMYEKEGIVDPEDVTKCTKEYQRNNDNFMEFVEQEMEKDDRGFISMNDTFSKFNYWIKENAPHIKQINKKVFQTAMDKIMGKNINHHRVQGWKGYRFKQDVVAGEEVDNLEM